MRQRHIFLSFAGLSALALAAPAAAGCGLNVNPAALDSNRNAELSRNETAGSPLAGVFDRVDTNHDGTISQSEYAARCSSLRATNNNGWDSGWEDSVAGERAERQRERQNNRINNRVNRETDRASDSAVDKVMGAIFGN
jgi:hypothetical protein